MGKTFHYERCESVRQRSDMESNLCSDNQMRSEHRHTGDHRPRSTLILDLELTQHGIEDMITSAGFVSRPEPHIRLRRTLQSSRFSTKHQNLVLCIWSC